MFQLFNLNKSSDIEIESVSFYLKGNKFEGGGILEWNPKYGFKLNADVKTKDVITDNKENFGTENFIPKKQFHLKINNNWKAYSSSIFFSEWHKLSILVSGKISISFDNLIFFSDDSILQNSRSVIGKCYLRIEDYTIFQDTISDEDMLFKENVSINTNNRGLKIESDEIKIIAYYNKQDIFELNWQVSESDYTNKAHWNISKAMRDTLSICLGQSITLIRRDIYRKNKTIIELLKEREIVNLGLLSPFLQDTYFNKELFIKIFRALIKNDKKSTIILNLFYQISDCRHIRNFNLWEFIMSTSLEATLRTYYEKPFKKSKKEDEFNNIEPFFKKFRIEFFNDEYNKEWKKIFNNVNKIFNELRHINAHPDWINPPIFFSTDNKQERYNLLVYLSKFYGYIILALIGYKNIKPANSLVSKNFPVPVRNSS